MNHAAHHLRCLEVWSDNGAAAHGVSMPGLDVAVFARPYGSTGSRAPDTAPLAQAADRRDAEGGDIHYVSSCGTGRISRILVADVAGHGPKVAGLARVLRDLMRRHINTVNQAGFVESMNTEFTAAAADSGGRFATAIVATYWAPTSYLVACNAGHPRPLAYSKRSRKWTILTGTQAGTVGAGSSDEADEASTLDGVRNLPLGILDDTKYTQFAVKLAVGDLVVLYTDALLECRIAGGAMLGEDGLLACLAELPTDDPGALPRLLFDAVMNRCGTDPDDDVTVMVLAARAGPVEAKFLERTWAGVRFLGLLTAAVAARVGIGSPSNRVVPWPEFSWANLAGSLVPAFGLTLGRKAKGLHEL